MQFDETELSVALQDTTFHVDNGEFIAVVGPSGAANPPS